MISLAGLSATYPGYQAAEDQAAKTAKTDSETQNNQTKQRDAAIRLLGANVAGAALAGQPGGGPQPPAPGQPSVPSALPSAPPSGAPPPQMSPPGQPMAGAPGKMGLQQAVAQILQTAPNVRNHPEILLSALTHFNDLGLLDPEAGAKLEETSKLHTAARVAAAKGLPSGAAPAATETSPAASPMPTATDPKTGAKVQWDGKAWQPLTN